jgi:hypothetical protein
VSQISPPIRIVLVAAVALIGAWMLFLRPKTETTPPVPQAPPTAPGVKGLTNDIQKAKDASATSDAANAKLQAATGGQDTANGTAPATTTAKPATGAAAKGADAAVAGLPVRVQKALDAKKILVLFLYNPKGADDRLTKKAVAKIDRWNGQVVVQKANVAKVARYGKIARGANVEQSPTIVVVDRNQKAERLVGFQDKRSVDQAVVDAMRNSGGIIKDKYLSAINSACATTGVQQTSIPEATTPSEIRTHVARQSVVWKRFLTRFAAIKAPGKWKGLKRAALKDGKAMSANYTAWLAALGSNPSPAKAAGTWSHYAPRSGKLSKSWNARMDKHNVLSCGAQT